MAIGGSALKLKGITKIYPRVRANDGIDLEVRYGDVLALVGENGAGKSTLMRIAYGLTQPDAGEILVSGKPVKLNSPADAIAQGIGMVQQHFSLVEPFTVLENVILGAEPTRGRTLDLRQASEDLERQIKALGFELPLSERVEALSLGQRQQLEIVKAIYRKARILILDEPTAVLTPLEAQQLFDFIHDFVANNGAVIFISHHLDEVMAIADRISVLRDGRVVGSFAASSTSPAELARLMVGRELPAIPPRTESLAPEVMLEVAGLTVGNQVRGVSFRLRAGEILGIAGVEGNGQSELVAALAGLVPYTGAIRLFRGPFPQGAREVREAGVSHIPEDRNAMGLVASFSAQENLILGDHYRAPFAGLWGLFDLDYQTRYAEKALATYDVRPAGLEVLAGSYSGGNAQKVVVARELSRSPRVLLAAQPTRGVDIGAMNFIHQQILRAREAGVGIVLVSADINEVLTLADRILVMFGGQILAEVPPSVSQERLGLLLGGTKV